MNNKYIQKSTYICDIMDEKEKIEKIMQTENLNSVQFAAEIGIQGSTLSHILNGRNKPSLDVLKRILNRFRTINSDWLILDIGSMYRTERNSQTLSLFDNYDENSSESVNYNQKTEEKRNQQKEANNFKTEKIAESTKNTEFQQEIMKLESTVAEKRVKKIIVYYSDNTFEEFTPN